MNQENAMLSAEKKRTKAILGVLIPITIAVVVLTVVVGIMSNKAGNKTPVTSDGFIEIAYQQGCKIYDETKEMNESLNAFKNVYRAEIAENNSVFFMELNNKKDAMSCFANFERIFKSAVKESGTDNSQDKDLENYCYYTATADGKYMHIIRVKNTVVHINIDEQYAKSAKKIVDAMNY